MDEGYFFFYIWVDIKKVCACIFFFLVFWCSNFFFII
jgi:hypothetical protein